VQNHNNPAGLGARNVADAFGNTVTGHYFHGTLDDVRVYDRALTAAEAVTLADGPQILAFPPVVGSLSVSPATVASGGDVTLTALDVADYDGTVSQVDFYLDSDNDGQLDSQADTLLATDSDGADGYSADATLPVLDPDTQVYFAVATDDSARTSDPAMAEGQISSTAPADGLIAHYALDDYRFTHDPTVSWRVLDSTGQHGRGRHHEHSFGSHG